jgi:predicted PurR-regulated permease PerM
VRRISTPRASPIRAAILIQMTTPPVAPTDSASAPADNVAPDSANTSANDRASYWLRRGLPWLVVALIAGGLFYALAPALTPFIIGGILAYMSNPLVDSLVRWRLPRPLAAVLVLVLAWLLLAALVLMMVPLIRDEIMHISALMPQVIAQFNAVIAPWAERVLGVSLALDTDALQQLLKENTDFVRTALQRIFDSLRLGGLALAGVVANALLAPVVTFYLLCDWHAIIRRIDTLIPRARHARIICVAKDIDEVLSAYLRGQLLVMAILAAYYSIALAVAGIPSALALGVLTGTLIFIPYIGFAASFVLALSVAVLQFAGWPPVLWVLAIYGVGQVIESLLLTPYLVGEKVGLSPLAVIFALMAFGQLFGFVGVLMALPAAAAVVIGLRELHRSYLDSALYRGE